MKPIEITVRDKVARLVDLNAFIVCGNNKYTVEFDFDSEWDEYEAKTAVFKWSGNKAEVAFTGNQCRVPIINNTVSVEIGVFAGDLQTTTGARVNAKKSVLCGTEKHHEPEPDVYNQLMELIKGMGGGSSGDKANVPVTIFVELAEDNTFVIPDYTTDALYETAQNGTVCLIGYRESDGEVAELIAEIREGDASDGMLYTVDADFQFQSVPVLISLGGDGSGGIAGELLEAPAAGAASSGGGIMALAMANIPCENRTTTYIRIQDGEYVPVNYEELGKAWIAGAATLCVMADVGADTASQYGVFRPILKRLDVDGLDFTGVYWVEGDAAYAHGLKHASAHIKPDGTLTIKDLDDESGMLYLIATGLIPGESAFVLDKNMTRWTAEMLRNRIARRPVMLTVIQDQLEDEGDDGYIPPRTGNFRLIGISGDTAENATATFHGEYWDDGNSAWIPAVAVMDADGKVTVTDASWAEVDRLSKAIEDLKQNGTGTGKGLTTEQIDLLDEIGNYIPFTSAIGGTKWNELIASLRGESSGEEEPDTPEVTLSSISASYTGGEVKVGTALTDLTGITVKATYSDGTTQTITDYALSGEIVEGENTITVSYNGKITTFTVVGVAESTGEDVEPLYTFENVENAEIKSRYGNASGTLTVSNGNHIRLTTEQSRANEWFWDINVSSFLTNGQSVSSVADTLFTIPSGATVKLCAKNVNEGEYLDTQARISLGATQSIHNIYAFIHTTSPDVEEFTFTVDEDTNVPCVAISVMHMDDGTPIDLQFDIEIYVNDARWI